MATKIVKCRRPHRCSSCKGWVRKGDYAVSNKNKILFNGEWVWHTEWLHPPCWKHETGEDLTHQLPMDLRGSGTHIIT